MRNLCPILLAAILALNPWAPALAETNPATLAKLQEVVDAAIKENVVFLNCSATDRNVHQIARQSWDEMTSLAILMMSAKSVDAGFVGAFRDRAAYDKMIRRDARFGEILEMCAAKDWMSQLYALEFVQLHLRVNAILEGK
jgi:hypothetical protein